MDTILEIEPDQKKSYCPKKFGNVIFYHALRLKKYLLMNNFLTKFFWDTIYRKNIFSKAKIIYFYILFGLLVHLTPSQGSKQKL